MSLIARLRRATRPLAIVGCVSIGTVYVLVGVLALLALSGLLTGSADEERMVLVVLEVPGGSGLIWGIVAGLAGYVVWRAMEVVADPYEFGSDWTGKAQRAGIGASALGYGTIAWSIAVTAMDGSGSNGESAEAAQQSMVGQVLAWPAGAWIVGAGGAVMVLVGVGQFVLLARRGYAMEIAIDDRSPVVRRVIHVLAWYGYAARGIILGVLGYFLLRSAWTADESEAGDTDTAFDFIGGGVVGDSAFFLVAVGTIAYGFFMYACARYYQFGRRR
jgi:hypothetical protein